MPFHFNQLKLTQFLENNPSCILITDLDAKIEYVNPQFERLTGYTKEEVLGKNPNILQSGFTEGTIFSEMWETLLSGKTWHGEFSNKKKSGEYYWELVSISPIFDDQGNSTHYIAIKQDITKQKLYEKILSNEILEVDSISPEKKLFALLAENMSETCKLDNVIIGKVNTKNSIIETLLYWSKGVSKENFEFNYTDTPCQNVLEENSAIYSGGILEIYPSCDLLKKLNAESYAGTLFSTDVEDNQYVLIGINQEQIVDESLVQVTLQVYSARIKALIDNHSLKELANKEKDRYQMIFEHMSSGCVVYESLPDCNDYIFKSFNKAAEEIEGLNRNNVIGKKLTECFPGVKEFGLLDVLNRVIKTGKSEYFPLSFYNDNRIQGWRENFIYRISPNELCVIYKDLTKQKQLEESLKISEDNLKRAQQVAKTGSWYIDLSNNKLICSDETYRIFDIPKETDLTFEKFLSLVHPDDVVEVTNAWNRAMDGEEYDIIHRIITDDEKWIRERATLEFGHNGELLAGIGTVQDVTEIVITQRKLERVNVELTQQAIVADQLREEAERANWEKSQFLASMSHDIRSPMSSIISIADILESTELTTQQKSLLRNVQNSGETLLALMNDILDLSKIEAGKLELNSMDLAFHELLSNVTDSLAVHAQAKGVELICLVNTDVPAYIRADALRIKQIYVNLINNAIKFTEKGDIVIDVTLEETTPEYYIIKTTVSDTGIGIEKEELDLIFAPFKRSKKIESTHEGTGLGLSIVKNLCGMMDGEISVKSEYGNGTEFTFTMKVLKSDFKAVDLSIPQFAGSKVAIKCKNKKIASYIYQLLSELNIESNLTIDKKDSLESCDIIFLEGDPQITLPDNKRIVKIVNLKEFGVVKKSDQKNGMVSFISKPISKEKMFLALSSLNTQV